MLLPLAMCSYAVLGHDIRRMPCQSDMSWSLLKCKCMADRSMLSSLEAVHW